MSAGRAARLGVLAACAALVGAVFWAFRPALSADFQLTFDDDYNIVGNGFYRGLSPEHLWWMLTASRLGHWQPLSWLTLAIDHALWGMDPHGYHLTNVALHALNAVLAFFLCRAVLRAARAPSAERIWPAFAAALLFAVHPLRVESVAWVTERRDVLSLAFLLSTVLAWLRWRAGGASAWYALALGSYALSLLSKAWGITLPAVLLVLDVWPAMRFTRATALRLVLEKVPFMLLAAGAAGLAYWAQQKTGAIYYAEHFTPLQKAAQAAYGLAFYVHRTVWPAGLSPVYLLDLALDPTDARFLFGFAATAVLAAAAFGARRRWPALTAALVVYAILVSPVLGLTQSGIQLVADRYTYVATLPFAVLAAGALGAITAPLARRAALLTALLAAAVLGWRTYGYARVWHDSWSLWRYTLERDPENSFACNQLGLLYRGAGDDARAMELFETAVRVDPSSYLAFENRGIMRFNAGDQAGALADWDRAIALNGRRPIPIVNRGSMRFQTGDFAGARADYERALELGPDQPAVWYMLASTRFKLGDAPGARAALLRCLEQTAPGTPLDDQARSFLSTLPP